MHSQSKLDYIAINKTSWNSRTIAHIKSDFYDMEGFLKGNSSLDAIELDLLGEVENQNVLHLQCHFGQDTISLARLGANVTGVDLSDKAIAQAEKLASKCGVEATFICSDVYDVPQHLDKQYDIVFSSYGTIVWLPDMEKWAGIVAKCLKPGGKFIFVEFHPVVEMLDDDFQHIQYSYFNTGAIVETVKGTYADRDADFEHQSVSWNHSMSEVIQSLIRQNLEITSIAEFDYSPYDCFKHTIEVEPKKYQIEHLGNKIPMVYAISAMKKD